MSFHLSVSPHGQIYQDSIEGVALSTVSLPVPVGARIELAFQKSVSAGLLHLGTVELQTVLPPDLAYMRDFASTYFTALCHTPIEEDPKKNTPLEPPQDLASWVLRTPPMRGSEYINEETLRGWWNDLDQHVRAEMFAYPDGPHAYLRAKNPVWRLVGRVTLHLAENKRDADFPFAFMATYAQKLSSTGQVQHIPLNKALEHYSGANDRAALINLFTPLQQASEASPLFKKLLDSKSIYQAIKWTIPEAYAFLKEIPVLEANGLIVRIPNWWNRANPPRPQVSVKIGNKAQGVGASAILDFSIETTLGGETLTLAEINELLKAQAGLISLRGKWVEVDQKKLKEALGYWQKAEAQAKQDGLDFYKAMRLLSGTPLDSDSKDAGEITVQQWSGLTAGAWLAETLKNLTDPSQVGEAVPKTLKATLRPYQEKGFRWLKFATQLRLGVCLADDMGLGKTIQILTLLLALKEKVDPTDKKPNLLIVPASLVANWLSEIQRFAEGLSVCVAHPSEIKADLLNSGEAWKNRDLVITTYGMIPRLESLQKEKWGCVILDEAQAIKNAGTKQTRSIKKLTGDTRIALTGTPVENRLGDLWSIYDFLNPGLLGSSKEFSRLIKKLESRDPPSYEPVRTLIKPYLLRRLKTDKSIIDDLPDKTEVKAFCTLTKVQAALYQKSVEQMKNELEMPIDGIKRKGLVLAYLTRFKQICNHPSHWLGDGEYTPESSGKFARLAEIVEELSERQEKALIFTQFQEMSGPLATFLAKLFQREGLILTGDTPLPKRKQMVDLFQRDDGPPFFVLSLKAGGTGLNLTNASQVIHFDRWWNPAVENQATDRAFRLGQKKNVLVHKFVCRGTIEEKIDAMIETKSKLAGELVEGGSEKLLTEMSNAELLSFVALDIHRAVED